MTVIQVPSYVLLPYLCILFSISLSFYLTKQCVKCRIMHSHLNIRELGGGELPGRLTQAFLDEASFEMRSPRSAQHLSPELACREKTAWAERCGQEAWTDHIIEYRVHMQGEGFPL